MSLLENLLGNLSSFAGQGKRLEELQGFGDGKGRYLADVPSPDPDQEGLRLQPALPWQAGQGMTFIYFSSSSRTCSESVSR